MHTSTRAFSLSLNLHACTHLCSRCNFRGPAETITRYTAYKLSKQQDSCGEENCGDGGVLGLTELGALVSAFLKLPVCVPKVCQQPSMPA